MVAPQAYSILQHTLQTVMSSELPSTMKALVIEEGHRVAIKDHPVPDVGDNDILIKTVAVSQNPTDWKHVHYPVGKPGTVLGCDFSGTVVKTGKNVDSPKLGDHVAGFTHGGALTDEGAFAEYVKTPADLVWVVPRDTFTHEQAAALGCAFWTAIQALYHPTRLALVEPPKKVSEEQWLLIYGGSSGVGLSAIQLAHLSGYKVVTTASPHNFDLVRSFGADEVFDYKDSDVVSKIKRASHDSITKALDTISSESSQKITAESLAPSGGQIITLQLPRPEVTDRKDVDIKNTLLYTALGRAFDFGPDTQYPVSIEDRTQIVEFLRKMPKLAQEGHIKPLPIKLWEGGLGAIPDGLQYMKEGKVSGVKLVYRV